MNNMLECNMKVHDDVDILLFNQNFSKQTFFFLRQYWLLGCIHTFSFFFSNNFISISKLQTGKNNNQIE